MGLGIDIPTTPNDTPQTVTNDNKAASFIRDNVEMDNDNLSLSISDLYGSDASQQTDKGYPAPTNEDFYVNPKRATQIGQYSGSMIGTVPIFGGGGSSRVPLGAFAKYKKGLMDAMTAKQKQLQKPFNITRIETDDAYQANFDKSFHTQVEGFIGKAQDKYGAYAFRALEDGKTKIGREYNKFLSDSKTFADEIDNVVVYASELKEYDGKPGSFVPPAAKKAYSDIMAGVDDYQQMIVTDRNYKGAIKQLKGFRDVLPKLTTNIVDKIEKDIETQIKLSHPDVEPGSTEYYDVFFNIQTQMTNPDRIRSAAEGFALMNPNEVYDPNGKYEESDQPFSVDDIEGYLTSMFSEKTEIIKSSIANKSKPGSTTINMQPNKVSSIGDSLTQYWNRLNNGELINLGKGSYMQYGNGMLVSSKNGVVKRTSTNSPNGIVTAMLDVISTDPAAAGLGANFSVADATNNLASGYGGSGEFFTAKLAPLTKATNANRLSDASNGNIIDKTNAVYETGGPIQFGENAYLTSASGTGNKFSFKGKANNKSFNGVIIPSASIDDASEGDWNAEAAVVNIAGDYRAIGGNASYELSDDGKSYFIKLANDEYFKIGKNKYKINRADIDVFINGEFEDRKSAYDKTDLKSGATQTITQNVSGNKNVTATGDINYAKQWDEYNSKGNAKASKLADGTRIIVIDDNNGIKINADGTGVPVTFNRNK